MPKDMFTEKALDNLRKIVNAKGELISKVKPWVSDTKLL